MRADASRGILGCTVTDRTPDAAPNPVGRKARTRLAILEAAGELFASQGVPTTPVEQIADRAGVSVGALYAHFGSKQGLVLAFISDALDVVEGFMEEARQEESPLQRVCAAGDAYFRFAAERPAACRFAAMRVLQPDPGAEFEQANRAMSKRTERIVLGIAADLKLAMDAGEVAVAPIDEMMVFLWGLWNGVTTLMVRQDGAAIPADLANRSLMRARKVMAMAADFAAEHPGEEPRQRFGRGRDGTCAPTDLGFAAPAAEAS